MADWGQGTNFVAKPPEPGTRASLDALLDFVAAEIDTDDGAPALAEPAPDDEALLLGAAKSRPSRPVLGGETGEDACRVRDDADWQGCRAAMATCGPDGIAYFDMATKCTADDARGPA